MFTKLVPRFQKMPYCHLFQNRFLQTQQKQTTSVKSSQNNNQQDIDQKDNQNQIPIFHHIQQILQYTKLKAQQSVFIDQKHEKSLRKLTQEQKLILGVNIPKKPLKRLTQARQKQYVQALTSKLYEKQALSLNEKCVKILQKNHFGSTKLDQYINLLYKDTYARFLISKGIKVSWNSYKSSYGIMNAQHEIENNQNFSNKYVNEQLLKIFYNNSDAVKLKNNIGLYSSRYKKFVPVEKVEMEVIKKIGYFHKIQLTQFGKYADSFNILKQKGEKIYLLVYTDFLHKVINPDALCVSPGTMLTLVHDIQQDEVIKQQYFVTSLENYLIHQTYFNKNKYRKHNSFDSSHLLQMKCNNLPLIPQTEKYERKTGIYIVKGSNSLQDFDRLLSNNISVKPNTFLNQNGFMNFISQNINICDAACSQKLFKIFTEQSELNRQILNKLNVLFDFVELYDSFEDQIFYHSDTKQVLFFNMGSKIVLDLTQPKSSSFKAKQQLLSQLSGQTNNTSIIIQSKAQIKHPKKFHKARQKRRWKKQVKKTQEQMTSYPHLLQAIEQINQLKLSSPNYSEDMNIFPIFTAFIDNQYTLLKIDKNIYSKIKVLIQNDKWSQQQFKQLQKQVQLTYPQYKLHFITIQPKFEENLNFIYQQIENEHSFDSSVIIQPQHSTESYLPESLVLNSVLKNSRQAGGRSVKKIKKNKEYFSLIKLHPTLLQKQADLGIQEILYGTVKANKKQQYGYGLQALKLWVCKQDNFLGDRKISDFQINHQLKLSTFIRNLYSDILTIYPRNATNTNKPTCYIDTFFDDHIDFYILNMQYYLKTLNLHHAYKLTQQFYEKYIQEIYLKTIRRNIIAYKNWNMHHIFVMKRILQLLGILSIIMPFSTYHITKEINIDSMPWPTVSASKEKLVKLLGKIQDYNRMVKLRTQLKNKLQINNFQSCWVQLLKIQVSEPDPNTDEVKRTIIPISEEENSVQGIILHQLAQFLDVSTLSYGKPPTFYRKFKLTLKKNHPFMDQYVMIVYQHGKKCIRCDPDSPEKQIICQKCLKYLQQQVCQ